MKRRWILMVLLVTLLLVVLDQGTKLWVDRTFTDTEHASVSDGSLHVHPHINDRDTEALTPIAERLSVDVRWLLGGRALLLTMVGAFLLLVMTGIPRFFLWDAPSRRRFPRIRSVLNIVAPACFAAGVISSSWVDELLWGGSLDWIAVVMRTESVAILPGHNHRGTVYHCRIWDIKDSYILLAVLMVFVYFVCMIVTLLIQPKAVRVGYDGKCKHPIRNFRALREYGRTVGAPRPTAASGDEQNSPIAQDAQASVHHPKNTK